VRAVVRRHTDLMSAMIDCRLGDLQLQLDMSARSVTINGTPLPATRSEFIMISTLVNAKKRTLSKEYLLEQLPTEKAPTVQVIDVFLSKLRRKLGEIHPDARHFIETVYNEGLRLNKKCVMTSARISSV